MWSGYSDIYDVFYVKTTVITVGDIMEHFEKNFYFLYEAVSLQKFVKKKIQESLVEKFIQKHGIHIHVRQVIWRLTTVLMYTYVNV